MTTEKYTILYARLSNDDGRDGESVSIVNQKAMLEKYAEEHGFENTLFLSDDGKTGVNFQRPGWNKVVSEIEKGMVETLIVKDLSRLGRDHIHAGQLIDYYFPNNNVRFIAIGSNVDTALGTGDFAPIENVFNEFYVKDCSRKTRAAHKIRAEKGMKLGGKAPYGYRKTKNCLLLVEEDSAEVVRKIFDLCIIGKDPAQIANHLNAGKILSPTSHYYEKAGVALLGYGPENPYKWNCGTIAEILENEVYLGHTVSLKNTTISYKNRKRITRPEAESVRFENTHEGIVSPEIYNMVQDLRKHKRRNPKTNHLNIFAGLVYCQDCGAKLGLNMKRTKTGKYGRFYCTSYQKNGKDTCSAHFIRESQLESVVLNDLQRVTDYARRNEYVFARHISKKSNAEVQKEILKEEKQLKRLEKRLKELTNLFKRLYEDHVQNKIPEVVFQKLSEDYSQEQKEVELAIPDIKNRVKELKESKINVETFFEKAKKYTELNELSPELLNIFIQKIVVWEREVKGSAKSFQQVDIYYRDIGLLEELIRQEVC